jgi:hypothetical protein
MLRGLRETKTTNPWDSYPNFDRGPRWSTVGYFRSENIKGDTPSPVSDSSFTRENESSGRRLEFQPYKTVRVRKRHKAIARIDKPQNGARTNCGPIVSRRNLKESDVSGRTAAALDKIFRSKSQKARRCLEYFQIALVGHVFITTSVLRDTAKFLSVREGIVKVHKKPSFKAVRCLISTMKDCEATSFRMKPCLRTLSLCIP